MLFFSCFQCEMSSDDVCKEVECGKGTCKPSTNSTIPFECECEQGWRHALASSNNETGLKFLPCTTPNCKNSLSPPERK